MKKTYIENFHEFAEKLENDERDFLLSLITMGLQNILIKLYKDDPEILKSLFKDPVIQGAQQCAMCFLENDYEAFLEIKKQIDAMGEIIMGKKIED